MAMTVAAEGLARQRLRPVFVTVMTTKLAVALFLVMQLLAAPHEAAGTMPADGFGVSTTAD
ncbi:hypothetical protein M8R20_08495 [Pseudomonas sp. R2.Fl]|nr:hypothetical protein [Pseudomonas sp. R2.Fl]